jgi:hypothetical protein
MELKNHRPASSVELQLAVSALSLGPTAGGFAVLAELQDSCGEENAVYLLKFALAYVEDYVLNGDHQRG